MFDFVFNLYINVRNTETIILATFYTLTSFRCINNINNVKNINDIRNPINIIRNFPRDDHQNGLKNFAEPKKRALLALVWLGGRIWLAYTSWGHLNSRIRPYAAIGPLRRVSITSNNACKSQV